MLKKLTLPPSRRPRTSLILLVLLSLVPSCSDHEDRPGLQRAALRVQSVESPSAPNSGQQRLTCGADGVVRLSWIEKSGQGHVFKFAAWKDGGWSSPRIVASGDDWFVNWADMPSLAVSSSGVLAAHWLQRMGKSTYAYGIRYAMSGDGGATWSVPEWLHTDAQPTEHGFASIVPVGGDRFAAVWLDGNALGSRQEMELRAVTLSADGSRGEEKVIDTRVCECCATTGVATKEEVLVAYRNRDANDVRDISLSRLNAGKWSAASALHDDLWKTPG